MKTIVYILPYLEKGGTETHVLELIKGFIKKDYNIILIAPPGPRLEEFKKYEISYIPFISFNLNIYRGISSFRKALKEIVKYDVDIIHIHGAHELIPLTKFFLKKLLKKKTPIVFTVHGYHGLFSPFSYKTSSFCNNLWANYTITVSNNEKKLMLKAGLDKEKCRLIHNGISKADIGDNTNLPKNLLCLRKENKIAAYIGRLEKEKGIIHLLEALSYIKNENIHLLIIGSGSLEKKLKEEANNLSLNNITFTGYIKNIDNYLNLVDIFILPSLQEPFGLVCIEAMSHKIPVIATRVGGIPEIVIDKKTGYLVPPANSRAISEKIHLLVKNDNIAKELGRNGYKRYLNLFTVDSMISRTNKVYQETIN